MVCNKCGNQNESSAKFCSTCGAPLQMDSGTPVQSGPAQAGSRQVATALAGAEERNWAMGAHLSALLGLVLPFGNVVGPLLVWLIKKDQSTLVDQEGKEALNFQISMTIYMMVSAILITVLIGFPMLFGFGIADLILVIIAAVKTSSGERYRYPITFRFLT